MAYGFPNSITSTQLREYSTRVSLLKVSARDKSFATLTLIPRDFGSALSYRPVRLRSSVDPLFARCTHPWRDRQTALSVRRLTRGLGERKKNARRLFQRVSCVLIAEEKPAYSKITRRRPPVVSRRRRQVKPEEGRRKCVRLRISAKIMHVRETIGKGCF